MPLMSTINYYAGIVVAVCLFLLWLLFPSALIRLSKYLPSDDRLAPPSGLGGQHTQPVSNPRSSRMRVGLGLILGCLLVVLVFDTSGRISPRAILIASIAQGFILPSLWRDWDYEAFGWVILAVFILLTLQHL